MGEWPATRPKPPDQLPNTRLLLVTRFVDYLAHGCQHRVRCFVHVVMRIHYNLPPTS
jgi:hypothetical protein